jgi:putative peptide zinc metalloprotease protein
VLDRWRVTGRGWEARVRIGLEDRRVLALGFNNRERSPDQRSLLQLRRAGVGSRRMSGALELVLPNRTRVPLVRDMTIGRAPGSTVRLSDAAVSRQHARLAVSEDGGVTLEDAGSTYGTWLDGRRLNGPRPLRDGSRVHIGNHDLLVERRRDDAEAGRTIVVSPDSGFGENPRMRSAYALKRLEASEGDARWVLRDLESNRFLRMSDADALLVELLDGRRSLAELVREAERLDGAAGPARLARLLAELADRGLLAAADGSDAARPADTGLLARLTAPRAKSWDGAGAFVDRVYRHGGRRLLTAPALVLIAALAVAGLAVFPYLVVARYGTPFVVAQKLGFGALIFLLGRFAIVALHETAHGLVMASFGRRIRRAGLKLMLVFPYAFVDTSEAWFEPRRRRIAISAAGPICDLSLGALFSLCCLGLPAGTGRDIFFQLAFAAYLGAFFNLNPFVERDGYQILVDVMREPGLRRRARAQLARRLSGHGREDDSRALTRYGAFGAVWSALAACFAVGMSLRYEPRLAAIAPEPVVWAGLCVVWLGLFLPVVILLGLPMRARRGVRGDVT